MPEPSWPGPSSRPGPSSPGPSWPGPSWPGPSSPGPSSPGPSCAGAFFAGAFFATGAFFAGAFFATGAFFAGAFFATGAFFAGAFFATGAFFAGAFLAAVLAVVLAVVLAAFALPAELRETTLRAAAPARLAKDFLVADAMALWGPLSGEGMSCVVRGGARICCPSIPFNPPCRRHHPNTVAAFLPSSGTLDAPQGVEGTSTRLHGHERAGDGESPVARQPANIIPEPLEETWSPPGVPAQ